jgi:hypothetical protein
MGKRYVDSSALTIFRATHHVFFMQGKKARSIQVHGGRQRGGKKNHGTLLCICGKYQNQSKLI